MSSRYAINIIENDDIPVELIEVPSSTQISGIKDKSDMLKGWVARTNYAKALEMFSKALKNKEKLDKEKIDTILSYAKDEYTRTSEDAKDIGKIVHNLIETDVKAQIDGREIDFKADYDEKVLKGFFAFKDWEKDVGVKWLESEQTVCQLDGLPYAGTLDLIGEIDGKIIVIDVKTSSGFYDDMILQVASYRNAREQMDGKYKVRDSQGEIHIFKVKKIKIDGMGILRLDKKTGLPEYKSYKEEKYQRSKKAFMNLLEFFYNEKTRRLKHNPAVY